MAAMLVASSTAVGVASAVAGRDSGVCSSSAARPQQQLAHAPSWTRIPGTVVSPVQMHVQSRGAAFRVLRSTMTENPTPVCPPLRLSSIFHLETLYFSIAIALVCQFVSSLLSRYYPAALLRFFVDFFS